MHDLSAIFTNVKYLVFCTVNVEEDVAEQEIMEIKIAKFQQSLCYLSVLSSQLRKSSPSLIHDES